MTEQKHTLNQEQREILKHTIKNTFFCGASLDMDKLCKAGLMKFAGRKSFVPDPYYSITGKGRESIK